MKKLIETYDPFDIVVVPFPFTDKTQAKKRPTVVLSSGKNFNSTIDHTVLAMITSADNLPWPLDVYIHDLKKTGLPKASVIRMKIFTIDNRLILKKIGALSSRDQKSLIQSIKGLLPDFL